MHWGEKKWMFILKQKKIDNLQPEKISTSYIHIIKYRNKIKYHDLGTTISLIRNFNNRILNSNYIHTTVCRY